jgi:hypothetical protein
MTCEREMKRCELRRAEQSRAEERRGERKHTRVDSRALQCKGVRTFVDIF